MKVKTNRKSNNKQQKYAIPVLPNRHINYAVVQTTPRKIEKHVLDYNDSLRKYFDADTCHRSTMLTFFMAVNGMIIDGHNAATEKLNLMAAMGESISNMLQVCSMFGIPTENESFINLEKNYEELAKLRLQLSQYAEKMEKLVKELVPLLIEIEKIPSDLKSATDKFNRGFKEAEEEIRRLNEEASKEFKRIKAAEEEAARKAAEETARQAEIQSLLARLNELGYKQQETIDREPIEVVEEIVERVVVPKIKITIRDIEVLLTEDDLKQEIYDRLEKFKGRKNSEFNDHFIETTLLYVQAYSFYKKMPRQYLFEGMPISYNGFKQKFEKELRKYNIKLYTRLQCVYDDE